MKFSLSALEIKFRELNEDLKLEQRPSRRLSILKRRAKLFRKLISAAGK